MTEREDLITLGDGAKLYACTQRHLSLLCRQGKLKSKRVGKRWYTTQEWLKEYFEYPNLIASGDPVPEVVVQEVKNVADITCNVTYITKIFKKIGFFFRNPLLAPSLIFSLLLLSVTFASFDPTPSLHTAKNFAGEAYNEHLAKHVVFIKEDLQPLTAKIHQARLVVGQVAGFWSKTRDNLTGFWGDVFGDDEITNNQQSITIQQPTTNNQVEQVEQIEQLQQQLTSIKKNLVVQPFDYDIEKKISLALRSLGEGGGITQTDLDNLNQSLLSEMEQVKERLSSVAQRAKEGADTNFQIISHTQKIDQLTNTDIINPTISSPTVTGTTALETLTVSNSTTISGDLVVTGAQSYTGGTTFSGNVGIGTSTPSQQLSISDLLYVGGTGTSTIEDNLHIHGQIQIGEGSTYISSTTMSAGSNFTITTQSDNDHLILQTQGRIGISTSTPWGLLSIDHNGADADLPVFVISDFGTSTPSLLMDWSGKLGLGTSSPFAKLSIAGGDVYIDQNLTASTLTATSTLIVTGTTGTSTIAGYFDIAKGLEVGTNKAFWVNEGATANSLIVDGSGNVGIGTASPTEKLDVNGNIVVADSFGSTILPDNTAVSDDDTEADATTGWSARSAPDTFESTSSGSPNVGSYHFHVDNNSAGYKGFDKTDISLTAGTLYFYSFDGKKVDGSDPAWQLADAGSNVLASDYITGTSYATFSGYMIAQATGNATWYFQSSANQDSEFYVDNIILKAVTAGDLIAYNGKFGNNIEVGGLFTGGGSSGLRVDSSGNVGIGTTSPWALLSVNAPAGQASFAIGSSTATSFVVDSSGNVGIGTANPGAKLDIPGATSNANSLKLGTNYRLYDSAGLWISRTSGSAFQINAENAGYITLTTNTNEHLNLAPSGTGNVGIGTTSPLTKFSIEGTAGQPVMNIASSTGASLLYVSESGNVGIGTASPEGYLDINNRILIDYRDSTVSNTDMVGIIMSDGTGGSYPFNSYGHLVIQGRAGSSETYDKDIVFMIDSTPHIGMIIDADGNVGIGTDTTPDYKLDVQGTFHADSTATFGGNVGIGTTSPDYLLDIYGGRLRIDDWTADGDIAVYKNNTTGVIGISSSDMRLKKNIENIENALDKISSLQGFLYNPIYEEDGERKRLGLSAQDLREVLPEATFTFSNKDTDEEYYGIHYEKLSALLVEAIKELDLKINELQTQSAEFSTPDNASGFMFQVSGILDWLADKVVSVKKLFVSDEVCIGDTCVNEEQLKTLLENANIVTSNEETATTTPEELPTPVEDEVGTPTPEDVEIEPEPEIESVATTTPEIAMSTPVDTSTTTPAE